MTKSIVYIWLQITFVSHIGINTVHISSSADAMLAWV